MKTMTFLILVLCLSCNSAKETEGTSTKTFEKDNRDKSENLNNRVSVEALRDGEVIIPVYRGKDLETIFMSGEGEELFRLPKGHVPVLSHDFRRGSSLISKNKNLEFELFQSGSCAVRSSQYEYYLINKKGEIVTDFNDKYNEISRCYTDYYLAWEQGTGYMVYLNELGENAFGEKRFKKAFPFSEGQAAVQLEKGDWRFINRQGEEVANIGENINGRILEVKILSKGYSAVLYKAEESEKIKIEIIDAQANIIFNLNEKIDGRRINLSSGFTDDVLIVNLPIGNDMLKHIVWVDSTGTIIGNFSNIMSRGDFYHGKTYVEKTNPAKSGGFNIDYVLVDKDGEEIDFLENRYSLGSITSFGREYFSANISKNGVYWDALFRTDDLSMVFKVPLKDSKIKLVTSKLILLHNEEENSFSLQGFNGKLLWQSSRKNILYTDLQEALKEKDFVRSYHVSKSSDFQNGLFDLGQIRNLSLEYLDIEEIPVSITRLKNLEHLKIYGLSELKRIPKELATLDKLKSIKIGDCKRIIENLEFVIEKNRSLELIDLNMTELEHAFVQKMKKERPKLKISIISGDYDEEFISN